MQTLKTSEVTIKGIDCIVKVIRYNNSSKVRRAHCKETGNLVDVKFLRPRMRRKKYVGVMLPKRVVNVSRSIYEL